MLGLTFKEDCADLRNSKVVDIVNESRSYDVQVAVHDPQASPAEALHEYGTTMLPEDALPRADAIVAAAAHKGFKALGADALTSKLVAGGSLVDVKSAFDEGALRQAGATVCRL